MLESVVPFRQSAVPPISPSWGADGSDSWTRVDLFATYPEEQLTGIDVIIGLDIITDGKLVIEKIDGLPTLTFIPDHPDWNDAISDPGFLSKFIDTEASEDDHIGP